MEDSRYRKGSTVKAAPFRSTPRSADPVQRSRRFFSKAIAVSLSLGGVCLCAVNVHCHGVNMVIEYQY